MLHPSHAVISVLLRRFVLALLFAAWPTAFAHAQAAEPPPTPLPTEFSDAARKAYAQTMKEARELLAQKKYAEGIAKLDALSRERPREPQARFLKGVALGDQGKTDEAMTLYRDLAADFPELPEPHNNLAVLYAQKGEYDIARRELELAVAAAPTYAIAYENLGDVYARMAAAQYQKAGELSKANKTAPAKLKLVREVFAVTPPAVAP